MILTGVRVKRSIPAWVPIQRFFSSSRKMFSTVLLGNQSGAAMEVNFPFRSRRIPWPIVPIHRVPSAVYRSTRTVWLMPCTRLNCRAPGRSRLNPDTVPTQIVPSLVCRIDFTRFRLPPPGSAYVCTWPS